MRLLAIDPGYDRLGVAIIEGQASKPFLVMSDCVLPKKGAREQRLAEIARTISSLIATHKPDAVAIEGLFFGINKKTALGVAEARGAVLATAGLVPLPIIECTPQQVKIAVTGYGKASKIDIERMVPKLISLPEKKRFDDELDAIAVGITALASGLNRP